MLECEGGLNYLKFKASARIKHMQCRNRCWIVCVLFKEDKVTR